MKFVNPSRAKAQTGVSYLGGINSSAKLIKNQKVSDNYTYILYLAPAKTSGYQVCTSSTPECRRGCLSTSGRVKIEVCSNKSVIRKARIIKTKLFFENQEFFMRWMVKEMEYKQAKAKLDGYFFSARLNGTSDIRWENFKLDGKTIFEIFPDVLFYDYTKHIDRIGNVPANYHLTFSFNGKNTLASKKILSEGGNVAVIFNIKKGADLPATWNGYEVVDGDLTDFRPYDPKGTVVGLRWKNIANKADNDAVRNSCFVVQPEETGLVNKEGKKILIGDKV